MKYINTFTITLLSLSLAGCGGMNADQQNDTGFGDDDGGLGETGGEPFQEPSPIEDHGVADYCVVRAQWTYTQFGMDSEVNHLDVSNNEYWWHTLTREYGGWLDITGKPSPATVPIAYPADWPLASILIEDANHRGGQTSGLVSGYHLQLPFPGFSGLMDPGMLTYPYSVDIIADAASPGSAFRHSWMAPMCCNYALTDDELDSPAWQNAKWLPEELVGMSDCITFVLAAGVHADESGYPKSPDVRPIDTARAAYCITPGGSYNLGAGSAYAPTTAIVDALSVFANNNRIPVTGWPLGYAYATTYPLVFNYEWASQLAALNDWEAVITHALAWSGGAYLLSKFNFSVQAVVSAIIWIAENLYLPPDDTVHARYGSGGGCSFPAHLFLDEETNSWWSTWTCPQGYYAAFPQFSHVAPGPRRDGVTGTCRLDGVDGAPLVNSNDILAPSGLGTDTFVVTNVAAFADIVADLGGSVSPEFAQLIESANAERTSVYAGQGVVVPDDSLISVQAGDDIAWSSTPDGVKMSMADAMLASIGYDDLALTELSEILGWSLDVTHEWIDEQPIGTLAVLLAERNIELPPHLAERTSVSLRRHHAWHMRIESDTDGDRINDRVTFLHFVG